MLTVQFQLKFSAKNRKCLQICGQMRDQRKFMGLDKYGDVSDAIVRLGWPHFYLELHSFCLFLRILSCVKKYNTELHKLMLRK